MYRVVRLCEDSLQLLRPNPPVQQQALPLRLTAACIHIYRFKQEISLLLLQQLATLLELCKKEGIMVCKPINQINFKLEELYDAMVWVLMTVRQASVFDANNFFHHI